jgi:hypothetical protein
MKHWIFCSLVGLGLFWGCSSSENSRLLLQFQVFAGDETVGLNKPFSLQGRTWVITQLQWYMVQPTLTTAEDTLILAPDCHLFNLESPNTLWTLSLPPGVYTGFKMGLGVDSARNDSSGFAAIPAWQYPAEHPLSPAANMYWSWNPGYIFMKMEGRVDVNNNGDLAESGETFSIHPGLNPCYRTWASPLFFAVEPGQEQVITTRLVLDSLLHDWPLTPEGLNVHPMNLQSAELPMAEDMMNRFRNALVRVAP